MENIIWCSYKTIQNKLRYLFLIPFLTISLTSLNAFSLDPYAFEICDASCFTSPKRIILKITTMEPVTVEFSRAGTLMSINGIMEGDGLVVEHNDHGYISEYTLKDPKSNHDETVCIMGYSSDAMPERFYVYYGTERVATKLIKKSQRGRIEEAELEMRGYKPFKVKYKNYKFDNHNNWIYRSYKVNGVLIEEKRDIEYYTSSDVIPNIGEWICIIGKSKFYVTHYCEKGKSVQKYSKPYTFWIERNGTIGGTFLSSKYYAEIKDSTLEILYNGRISETFRLISTNNNGYIQIQDSKGNNYYLKAERQL